MERSSLDTFVNCFFRAVVVLNNPVGESINQLILLNYGCLSDLLSKFSIWIYLCYLVNLFGWSGRSNCRTRVCNVSCVERFCKLCQYNFHHPCLRATTWMLATIIRRLSIKFVPQLRFIVIVFCRSAQSALFQPFLPLQEDKIKSKQDLV